MNEGEQGWELSVPLDQAPVAASLRCNILLPSNNPQLITACVFHSFCKTQISDPKLLHLATSELQQMNKKAHFPLLAARIPCSTVLYSLNIHNPPQHIWMQDQSENYFNM